jgi:hypothetical protein
MRFPVARSTVPALLLALAPTVQAAPLAPPGTSASATCIDDTFEDNDSITTAAPVGEGSFAGLRSCASDADFYAIALSTGDEITVDVVFAHAEGDIDLALLDASGAVVATSESSTDDEQVSYVVPTAAVFSIRVHLRADAGSIDGNDYDLMVSVIPEPTTCPDDDFEENDSFGDPAPVSTGTITDLRTCDGDEDFYSIPLSTGDDITVDVVFAHAEGDIDLALLAPSGAVVAASASGDDDEQVVYTTPAAGVFLVRVSLAADTGSNEGNDYELDISIQPAPTTCGDDGLEENDSVGDPAPLTVGTTAGLRVCLLDDDYYSIPLSADDIITLDVAFAHAEGDVQIALLDPGGLVVATSESSTDDERIFYHSRTTGLFSIRVFLLADHGTVEGNDYDLSVAVGALTAVPGLTAPGIVVLVLVMIASLSIPDATRSTSRRSGPRGRQG